jgi:hypothetical protein
MAMLKYSIACIGAGTIKYDTLHSTLFSAHPEMANLPDICVAQNLILGIQLYASG